MHAAAALPVPAFPAVRPPRPDAPDPRRAHGPLTDAVRTLRHPVVLVGVVLTALAYAQEPGSWSGARYGYYLVALTPLWWATSAVVADRVRRDPGAARSGRALLAGLGPVGLTALVVAVGYAWLVAAGGVDLGDEPGRTLHALWTLPELAQPVVLGVLAVAAGAAVGRWLRWRMLAWAVLAVAWFAVGRVYWLFQDRAVAPFSVVQVQPLKVPVGPAATDPQTFPADWLLSAPGPYQDGWARLVVSPTVAALHDVYLLGLAALLAACVLAGPWRSRALVAGTVLVALGAAGQLAVQP